MKKYFLTLIAFSFFISANAQITRHYVSNTATGNNNGSSWQHAYTNLQVALDQIPFAPGDSVEIWVQTTSIDYIPTDSIGFIANDERNCFFNIPVTQKTVFLYGGFRGFETDLSQRNLNSNFQKTVFNGDIGTTGVNTDNIKRMLRIEAVINPTSWIHIDGFIFKNCYGEVFNYGSSLYSFRENVKIKNCEFQYNNTVGRGAAIYMYGNSVIENCTFLDNTAGQYGGAINFTNGDNQIVMNCRFYNNTASGDYGGAIKVDYATNAYFINSIFYANSAFFGSAIQTYYSKIHAINCNFIQNDGGSIISSATNNHHRIINSIFYKNTISNNVVHNSLGSTTLENCLSDTVLTGYLDGGNNLVGNPMFKFMTLNLPHTYLLELQPCSPCINAGNNTVLDSLIAANSYHIQSIDFKGRDRKYDGIVDIGTFEYFKDSLTDSGYGALYVSPVSVFYTHPGALDSVHVYNCNTQQIIQSFKANSFTGVFDPGVSGSYAYIYQYKNTNCLDTTSCYSLIVTPTSNSKSLYSDIKMYPNPSQNTVYLENLVNIQQIQFIDITGRQLLNIQNPSEKLEINVSDWNQGIYFVQILDKNGEFYFLKLIVNH